MAPEHWARVQLVRGESDAGLWDLTGHMPETRILVGSGLRAGWIVHAEGVHNGHFELYWDSQTLWVSAPLEGSLSVDGEPVLNWRKLTGRVRLEFGQAAMMIECSQSIALASSAEEEIAAYQAETAHDLETSANYGGLLDASTTFYSNPPPGFEQAPIIDDLSTGSIVLPEARHTDELELEAHSTKVIDDRNLVDDRPLEPPPTKIISESPLEPLEPPATKIVDEFDAAAYPPHATPRKKTESNPLLMSTQAKTAVISGEGNKFALPPIEPEDTANKKVKGIQKKYLIAGGALVLIIALIVFSSWKKRQAQRAREAARLAAREAQVARATEAADILRAQVVQDHERIQQELTEGDQRVETLIRTKQQRARARTLARLDADTSDTETEEAVTRAEKRALEELAVEAAMNNQLADSLAYYRRLARSYPDEESYRAMAIVLQAKVECRRGVKRDGTSCN